MSGLYPKMEHLTVADTVGSIIYNASESVAVPLRAASGTFIYLFIYLFIYVHAFQMHANQARIP